MTNNIQFSSVCGIDIAKSVMQHGERLNPQTIIY